MILRVKHLKPEARRRLQAEFTTKIKDSDQLEYLCWILSCEQADKDGKKN